MLFRSGRIGIGSSSLSLNKITTLGSTRTAFAIGGFAEYRLFPWLAGNVGLEYAQNGGADLSPRMFYYNGSPMLNYVPSEYGSNEIIRSDLRIHNLELPITARFSTPEMNGIKPFVMVGMTVGFKLGNSVTNYRVWGFTDDDGTPMTLGSLITATTDKELKDRISGANNSLLFGVGSEFSAFGYIFEIGVSYRLGLVNQNNFPFGLYRSFSSNSTLGYVAIKF